MTASSSSSPQRQHRGRAWASRWTAPRDDDNDADRRSHRASDAARRPTRLALARLADSIVDATASVARAPTRLFDVALKKTKTKAEFFKVIRVRGDGRCMFRSLAVGLAHIRRETLTAADEERNADQLRLAVAESLCRAPEKRKQFPEATTAISYEMTLQTYCQRLLKPSFWGGEPELLVLAKIVRRPIVVYIPAAKVKSAGTQSGYVPIQTYGREFEKGGSGDKTGKGRKPVRLLYNGQNHYDLLIP